MEATQREFAGIIGVSEAAIHKAIRSGRITKNKSGKIDVERGVADWERNRLRDNGSEVTATLTKARAKREAYAAMLKELEYQREAGKVIDKAELEKVLFRYTRYIRDGILSIPERVSAKAASLIIEKALSDLKSADRKRIAEKISTDVVTQVIHDLWKEESKTVLTSLADGVGFDKQ